MGDKAPAAAAGGRYSQNWINPMDIQDLRIFARVARVQNLSAVGAELNSSPGTISKRLQSLEAELAVRLFDRTTRSINITEEGEKLLGDIERILHELDEVLDTLRANVSSPRGRLRVAAPTSLGRNAIASAICAFMQRFEEIDVHIDLTDRVVSFPDSGYDVAIRTGQLADSSLIARRLAADPHVVVASPDYIGQHGKPATPGDLQGRDCLILADEQVWAFVGNGQPFEARVSGRLRSDNGELLRHACIEGMGILKISRARVADALEDGRLVPILESFEAGGEAAIWAVYPSPRHLLPKLRVFLDFLSEWFKAERKARSTIAPPTRESASNAN
jgi:DNA-binding transcriptional LysR family regulator